MSLNKDEERTSDELRDIRVYFLVIIIMLTMYSCGSLTGTDLPSSETADANANPTAQSNNTQIGLATPTDAKVGSIPSLTNTQVSFLPLVSAADPTATQANTAVASPTATQANIAALDYCNKNVDSLICITSFNLSSNNTLYMVFSFPQNDTAERYYIEFDGIEYDCVPVAGKPDLYYCPNLPSGLNRAVRISVFSSETSFPLAEGNIFLNVAQVVRPSPTARPTAKPPDPYQP